MSTDICSFIYCEVLLTIISITSTPTSSNLWISISSSLDLITLRTSFTADIFLLTTASAPILLTDLSFNTQKGYERNPDDENRLFYVGATRAKENLHIIEPKDFYKSYQV